VAIGSPEVTGGYASLRFNTTGSYNTALGSGSLGSNTTASNNTAVGYQAGYTNTTGTASNYLGRQAGYTSNANYCTMMGDQAGYSSSGIGNTFFGYYAGGAVTSGTYNNFFGYGSGNAITSGGKNTILGSYNGNQGGLDIRTASNRIVLSDGDGNPRGIFTDTGTYLVGGISASDVNTNGGFYINPGSRNTFTVTSHLSGASSGSVYSYFYYANTEIGTIAQTGTTGVLYNVTSDYRLKTVVGAVTGQGARIDALEPIEYTWNSDGSRTRGFLAHKFQEVYVNSVTGTKDAVDADGKPKYQQMQAATSEVIADLVAEIQSLRKRLADAGL
jgi:hypothetical protein